MNGSFPQLERRARLGSDVPLDKAALLLRVLAGQCAFPLLGCKGRDKNRTFRTQEDEAEQWWQVIDSPCSYIREA